MLLGIIYIVTEKKYTPGCLNGLEMSLYSLPPPQAYVQINIEQQNDVTWHVETETAGPAGANPQVPSPERCPNVRRIALE